MHSPEIDDEPFIFQRFRAVGSLLVIEQHNNSFELSVPLARLSHAQQPRQSLALLGPKPAAQANVMLPIRSSRRTRIKRIRIVEVGSKTKIML
jgi:hypothetical protein